MPTSPLNNRKIILFHVLNDHCQLQAISEMLKQPSAIWEAAEVSEEHQELAKRLEVDIARCNAADLVYSPEAAACRHDAGGHMN